MDKLALQQSAQKLERLLVELADRDADAKALLQALADLLDRAKSDAIATPLEWRHIPGGRLFSEGGLRQYPELESAFAEFRIQLTGGETPSLRNLRAQMQEH